MSINNNETINNKNIQYKNYTETISYIIYYNFRKFQQRTVIMQNKNYNTGMRYTYLLPISFIFVKHMHLLTICYPCKTKPSTKNMLSLFNTCIY